MQNGIKCVRAWGNMEIEDNFFRAKDQSQFGLDLVING
jgi:hypothetical protein